MKTYLLSLSLLGSCLAHAQVQDATLPPAKVAWELQVHGLKNFDQIITFERSLRERFPTAELRLMSSRLFPEEPVRSQAVWQVSDLSKETDWFFASQWGLNSFSATLSGLPVEGVRLRDQRDNREGSQAVEAGPRGFR